jgi:hypothetical protein
VKPDDSLLFAATLAASMDLRMLLKTAASWFKPLAQVSVGLSTCTHGTHPTRPTLILTSKALALLLAMLPPHTHTPSKNRKRTLPHPGRKSWAKQDYRREADDRRGWTAVRKRRISVAVVASV